MLAKNTLGTAEQVVQLMAISTQSRGSGDLGPFVQRFLETALQWFEAHGASVFFSDVQTDRYVLAGQMGNLVEIPEGSTIVRGEGLAGLAIADAAAKLSHGESEQSERTDIGSSMIVPLLNSKGKCQGVLNVSRRVEASQFSAEDLLAAETLGQQLALAVENARLISESQHMNDMLKVVLTHLGFGILSIDKDSQISHYNPEAVMLLGKVPSHGEPFSCYLFRCNQELMKPLAQAAGEGLNGKRFKTRLQTNQRVLTISGTPLSSKGVCISIQDVTELEHAQREHDRLTRLAEVGQMTATIAHEIRNPLTGIISAAKMIRENPELSDEFAEIVEVESVKLARLCEEFLEFARPVHLDLQETKLSDLVDHVTKTMLSDFREAGVLLEYSADPNEPILKLDRRRMEQVIRNLLLNSIQASVPESKVSVAVGPQYLIIRDEGCGMTAATVNRLFSPFFTTKPKGTGLGLSMVRKVIDAHEAKIGVESEPEKGTTFTIRFNQEINR